MLNGLAAIRDKKHSGRGQRLCVHVIVCLRDRENKEDGLYLTGKYI